MKISLSNQRLLKAAILCGLGLLIYANSFKVPFQFDDHVVVVDNKSIHLLPDWPATIGAIFDFQPSRFLTLLTFALNYYVHRMDVGGYHLVNVLIHLLTGMAVWWLGERLLALSVGPKSQRKSKKTTVTADEWLEHVPLVAALLFIAHPVNTQAVTYIAQRAESLAALFYVTAVCCFIQARSVKKQAARSWIFCGVSGILAMLSKETSITLPLTILMVEFFLFRQGEWKVPTAAIGLGVLALLFVPALFHFDFAIFMRTYESQSHLGDVLTFPTYLLTQLRVFVTFLRLTFFPIGLNLDHDFVMSHSLFEPAAFLSFALIGAILFAAWRFNARCPMLSFAAFWFFLTLSSNLIPRSHVMFEHKLYLALTGTIPALCLGLYDLFKDRRLVIGLCVVIAICSLLTIQRNKVWQSPVTLWEDVVRKSPNKGRAQLSLGAAYASEGQLDKGIERLTKAVTLMDDPYVYTARGAAYVLKKDDARGLADFNKAIALNPQFIDAYINRGELYARRKEYRGAVQDFNKAIELRPDKPDGYKMRGRLNDIARQYDFALADYNRAIELDPADAQVFAWRGYINALIGRKEQALKDFEEAVRLNPAFAEGFVYRGMHRKESRQPREALEDFNRAIALQPSAVGYYQRGLLLFETGKSVEAMDDVNRAIALDPKYDLAYGLRARLFVEQKKLVRAMEDLNKSIEVNPEYIDGYLNRSLMRKNRGDLQPAIDDLNKAIALNSKASGTYSRRAKLYAMLKQYDLALRDFSTAIELDPRAGINYFNRSLVLKEMGQLNKAREDAVKARSVGYAVPLNYMQEFEAPQ